MRRSAAALLARPPPPPPPPPPLGLEAVQAAAAEAVRAAERKFAAVRAAVPSLVLAAPALLPARRALLSRAFSSTAPALPAAPPSAPMMRPTLPRARSGGDLQALPPAADPRRGGGGADGGRGGGGADGGRGEPPLSPRGAGPMLRPPRPPAAVVGAVAGRGDRDDGRGRAARRGALRR